MRGRRLAAGQGGRAGGGPWSAKVVMQCHVHKGKLGCRVKTVTTDVQCRDRLTGTIHVRTLACKASVDAGPWLQQQ
eukprot:1159452-Pelagomonas_calceolata.AAC.1